MFEGIGREIRSPATAIALTLFLISCVIGALTSFYFYRKGIVQGSIAFQVTQIQVFDKDSMEIRGGKAEPSLRVLDSQGQPIQENVYAAQMKVWNDGNGEIKPEDVRDQYHFHLGDGAKIISSDLNNVQSNNYDDFKLDQNGALTWRHFDPGTGILLRIIYSAKNQVQITFKGASVGLQDPELVSGGPPKGAIGIVLSKVPGGGTSIFAAAYSVFACVLVFSTINGLLQSLRRYQEQVGLSGTIKLHLSMIPWREIMTIVGVLVGIIIMGVVTYQLNNLVSTPVAPF